METSLLWDKPHNGTGKECEESCPSEGWTSGNKMRPQPTFPVPMWAMGEEIWKIECEVNLRKEEAGRFMIYFISHYLSLI